MSTTTLEPGTIEVLEEQQETEPDITHLACEQCNPTVFVPYRLAGCDISLLRGKRVIATCNIWVTINSAPKRQLCPTCELYATLLTCPHGHALNGIVG